MQMRSYGSDRHTQGIGDLLVAALLLMIKDENGPLDLAQALQLLFDGLLKLTLLQQLGGIPIGMGKTVFPCRCFVRERDMTLAVAAAALPLVLSHVNSDAIQIRGNQGIAAKAGQRAVKTQEDILGEIIEVLAAAGQAQQGAKDHLLMVAYHLLEGEIGGQAGLDHSLLLKFHSCE